MAPHDGIIPTLAHLTKFTSEQLTCLLYFKSRRFINLAPLIWVKSSQVSRLTLFGGKKAICRGSGPRAQGPVRSGVVPTTPRSLERARVTYALPPLCQ